MLIAPIFHNSYQLRSELQKDASPSVSYQNSNSSATTSKYNLFKSAFNRGTELIRNTFLPKSSNYSDASNSTFSSESTIRATSACAQIAHHGNFSKYFNSEFKEESCSSNDSHDSIQTELMYFKPIDREVRTFSNDTKILKVPSIRSSTSLSTSLILSPCSSPFFIPITSQRQSAFSFVSPMAITGRDGINISDYDSTKIKGSKKMATKYVKSTRERNLKRQKNYETVIISKTELSQKSLPTEIKNKTENTRKTRSMMKTKCKDEITAPSYKIKNTKKFKNSLKTDKVSSVTYTKKNGTDDPEFRRITRSMKN